MGLDETSLMTLMQSDSKVTLIVQWINTLVLEHVSSGALTIPPPILTRAFQQLANGMVAFQNSVKISSTPFPFPYAQACDALLLMHFIATPLVVAQWSTEPHWAFFFTFIQVFILWVLNSIAVEIENPFGHDTNDLPVESLQMEMNRHLYQIILADSAPTPTLSGRALPLDDRGHRKHAQFDFSLAECWSAVVLTHEQNEERRSQGSQDSMNVARTCRNLVKQKDLLVTTRDVLGRLNELKVSLDSSAGAVMSTAMTKAKTLVSGGFHMVESGVQQAMRASSVHTDSQERHHSSDNSGPASISV